MVCFSLFSPCDFTILRHRNNSIKDPRISPAPPRSPRQTEVTPIARGRAQMRGRCRRAAPCHKWLHFCLFPPPGFFSPRPLQSRHPGCPLTPTNPSPLHLLRYRADSFSPRRPRFFAASFGAAVGVSVDYLLKTRADGNAARRAGGA